MKPAIDADSLFEARDYREFLDLCFSQLKRRNPAVSYSMIASRAGFKARSYVREIFLGVKPVTTKGFDALCRGLQLTKPGAEYFRLLLALEFDDFNSKGLGRVELADALAKHRAKARKRSEHRKGRPSETTSFSIVRWPHFFAALGTCEAGATLAEVSSRTGCDERTCDDTLDEMAKHSLVRIEQGRFYPQNQHLIFQKMADDKKLQDFYLADLARLQKRIVSGVERSDHLFLDSTFSVHRSNLPGLRKALWDTLVAYIDDSEEPSGDAIVTLLCGLFPAALEKSDGATERRAD